MTKFRKQVIKIVSLLGVACLFFSGCAQTFAQKGNGNGAVQNATPVSTLTKLDASSLDLNTEDYYDSNVVYKLPDTIAQSEDLSVIVTMQTKTLMDAYDETDKKLSLGEYLLTSQGKKVSKAIAKERASLIKKLDRSGIKYVLGEQYDTLISGFEVTIKAKDFEKLGDLYKESASLMLGDVYEKAQTEVVTNEVDVYETGIFNSSNCEYQGDGVVVAVLDTGLDYTHTAFSVENFTTTEEAFTLSDISAKIGETSAANFTAGLTGEDVYVSKKVPFAYDYGDKDPDVLPINSEHGTHVAGVIAGKDDTIIGVAPNAQLAIMKVFSDTQEGAKDSWIIAALEDCVVLGVDVINMSLGSGCGFTREVDKENKNNIYDAIRETGISLITAAANDYNATFSSDKNGTNGLTSNPDSGTVGSPSTYEGALSVASVDGVKTPYLLYGEDIIYFNEASTSSADTKHFVDDILAQFGEGVDSYEFPYVTIPGIGRSSDYPDMDYTGKIVLVKRGTTTFEDKVRVALKEKGAAGIIIYNNISGTISMSVGKDIGGAVCSISQDDGEKLAAAGTGVISINKSQVAGPFMSDFSSWGPTSDLRIKPEITAHGGEILSAVPGQSYDRLSGTSMASPNLAGAAALIRQYVKYSGVFSSDLTPVEVTNIVNQLMMSTADIVKNKNGLPYAVRKQGAGLVNLGKATTTAAYLTTYDLEGALMEKTKFELGDDKEKTGVYTMTFNVNNVTNSTLTYDVSSIVITEGVSATYTSHGDTTVTQEGYLLDANTQVLSVTEQGSKNGNAVTVQPNGVAKVTVQVTLSDADKKYLNESFAHGMYVEGFINLTAQSGTEVDLRAPMLAFYGDWNEAPVFDEEYYDTHADEINAGLDPEDKIMADAYATRVIGGLYSDYIATLGSYYFVQDPKATQIAASKEHIALSNQEGDESSSTINSIYSINAGLLRNVKEIIISVVEDSTGKEVYTHTEYNQYKSYSRGGQVIPSSVDTDFSVYDLDLKNNTKYTVTVTAYIDYGTHEEQDQSNVRNVFEFPLYVDFEAPIVSDVVYRTEYDRSTKKTKLFADLQVYDNHYSMGVSVGQITPTEPGSEYAFSMSSFGKYVTPVYSSFNATSTVSIELTDYVSQIKNSAGIKYNADGTSEIVYNNNSFIVTCYDYAMNSAVYEIRLPDEIKSMYFTEEQITLNPNETKDLSSIINLYPSDSWMQVLDFESSDPDVATVVNQTILAKQSGETVITATGYDKDGNKVTASVNIKVLSPEDEGYKGNYSVPEVNKFVLSGYKTNKAYYATSSEEREIGITGGTYAFGDEQSLSMFPSESVTLEYVLDTYYPERSEVAFNVANNKIATVDQTGTIIAQAEGSTFVMVEVKFDGKVARTERVMVTVKDPFTSNSIYLMSYKGLGGTVVIPEDRGITHIYNYAFSNYEYVEKDLEAGDVINEEDPYHIKQMYIGEDTITEVIIPEGVTHINSYAFAKLTALEKVHLPSTLINIGVGAFLGCENLTEINLENVKFINEKAFSGCNLQEIQLDNVVAIGNYSFENCKLNYVELPKSSQSLGIGAFYQNAYLTSVVFEASKIKLGKQAFAGCTQLQDVVVNAAVIPAYAFSGCAQLERVTLGKDVAVIGEFAFADTKVSKFDVNVNNPIFTTEANGAMVLKGEELVLVAPDYVEAGNTITTNATAIATGAFSGNDKVFTVNANNATVIGAYAFADCNNLHHINAESVQEIGEYAFKSTKLYGELDLGAIKQIGNYAFAMTEIDTLIIADNSNIGAYAFAYCRKLENVTIGNNVVIGEGAFYSAIPAYTYENTQNFDYYKPYKYEVKDENGNVVQSYNYYAYDYNAVGSYSVLKNLVIGSNAQIELGAFANNSKLVSVTLGENTQVGQMAFYNCASLENIDFTKVQTIGDMAFAGSSLQYCLENNQWQYAYNRVYVNGEVIIVDYMYSSFAPKFASADLSNVQEIGNGAFMNNKQLATVTLNQNATAISAQAFANCSSLSNVTLPQTVAQVGEYAFYATALTSIDLTNVDTVGEGAFARTNLTQITLKDGAALQTGAFRYCFNLTEANGLEKVTEIGAQAFANTALTTADLQNAAVIGDFAFANSQLTEVKFGNLLVEVGENPFLNCEIQSYGKQTEITFNGEVIGYETQENYQISESVQVIDGVLYSTVPNGGLQLASYPMASDKVAYEVQNGTVRISANAFVGAKLATVTLPISLKAIGDKAFYQCENLSMVVFTSYYAPTLEEQYDQTYLTYLNMPLSGKLGEYEGLGISKYYMWNITSNYTNFYFGANFVDYISHIEKGIVMVKPTNGENYETFIMDQYFATVVSGSSAATEATLKVIQLINDLPANITLANEAQVVEARAAYNAIPTLEQQALVSNYAQLTSAEGTIIYLKLREEEGKEPELPPVIDQPEQPNAFVTFLKDNYVGIIIAGVAILALAGYITFDLIKKKKSKGDNVQD